LGQRKAKSKTEGTHYTVDTATDKVPHINTKHYIQTFAQLSNLAKFTQGFAWSLTREVVCVKRARFLRDQMTSCHPVTGVKTLMAWWRNG